MKCGMAWVTVGMLVTLALFGAGLYWLGGTSERGYR